MADHRTKPLYDYRPQLRSQFEAEIAEAITYIRMAKANQGVARERWLYRARTHRAKAHRFLRRFRLHSAFFQEPTP